MDIRINEAVLEEKLEALESVRTWSPRLISKLETFLRTSEDLALFRINPLRFSAEKNLNEQETIDLFLWATRKGIFQMHWELICPQCGDVVESFQNLRQLDSHFYCSLCQVKSDASLDDFIMVSFTVNPLIRTISYHSPETLSAEDLVFHSHFIPEARLGQGGPRFIDHIRRVIRDLAFIEPGQSRSFELEIGEGLLWVFDFLGQTGQGWMVDSEAAAGLQEAKIILGTDSMKCESPGPKSGRLQISVENTRPQRAAVAFLVKGPEILNSSIQLVFDPFLDAKRIFTTQTYRELFRNETALGTQGIGVKDITILFTDLKGSTEMYERIGDLNAFNLVHQHFESLGKVIANRRGAIIKTIGDAVMATFLTPLDAVQASLEMLSEIRAFNESRHSHDIILKIGIHKGPSIAVTLNDQQDYFGQTVNIAARVQALADAEEIYFSDEIYRYPGVQSALSALDVHPKSARLKGIQNEMRDYQVREADQAVTG